MSSNDEDKEFDFVIWSGLLPDLEQASSHKNEEQVKLFIINLPMYVCKAYVLLILHLHLYRYLMTLTESSLSLPKPIH